MEAALAFAEALAPEHLQLAGAAAEALAPRVRSAGCLFVGNARRHRVRRLRRGLQPHAAHRGRRALRLRPQRPPLPPPHGRGPRRRRRGAALAARRRCRSPRPRASPAHAASMAAASESTPVTRTAQITRKTGETDVSLTLGLDGTGAGTRSTGVGFFDHMLDLLARHGRLDLDGQRHRRPADRRAPHGRGHGHRARPGARPGARRPRRDRPLRPRRGADGRGARGLRARHLRPPVRAARRASSGCRRATIAGFEHEAAEEFFRAVASAPRG